MSDFPPPAAWGNQRLVGSGTVVPGLQLPTDVQENFACLFDGWIEIKTPGNYEFELGSDDGSRMSIGGAMVVDNGGAHAYAVKTGVVTLKKGFYPIRIEFFEAGGAERLTLRWNPPIGRGGTGGRVPDRFMEIPAGVLRVYTGVK
jgi:hypothetical protein